MKRGKKIYLIIGIILLFVVSLGAGFYLARLYPQSPRQNMTKENVFGILTRSSWCSGQSAMGDHSIYKFQADGSYSERHFSDYAIAPVDSQWDIEKRDAKSWHVTSSAGWRRELEVYNRDSIKFNGATLHSCGQAATDNRSVEDLPRVNIPEAIQKQVDQLSATKWKRTNDVNTAFTPTSIEFKKDLTYITTYRYGECQSTGVINYPEGSLIGQSPKYKCDARNWGYDEHLRITTNRNNTITINGHIFVPEAQEAKKAVLEDISGFADEVKVIVSYDIPLKSGAVNKIDVEITNVGNDHEPGPLKLERFYLTKTYLHDEAQHMGPENMIAKVELGDKVINPGESHKFSIDVTFKKSGSQGVYFNASQVGSTQAWNASKHYNVYVK